MTEKIEKFLITFERSEYKTIEVEAVELQLGLLRYEEPYISQIEELQKDGWKFTQKIQRIE